MILYLNKLIDYYKKNGFAKTSYKIIFYPNKIIKLYYIQKYVNQSKGIKDKFTKIYELNYWGSDESISGNGSTLEYTENIRAELPSLLKKFNIKSIFDAPCGDFNWMQHVIKEYEINYTGGDIVKKLIEKCNFDYNDKNIKFIEIDITKDKFPDADLMICRDCLFHLSFKDINNYFKIFLDSNIEYLLTTTFTNNSDFKNKDIITGDFRKIDLYSAPFNIPKNNLIYKISDDGSSDSGREMHLFKRVQLKESLKELII